MPTPSPMARRTVGGVDVHEAAAGQRTNGLDVEFVVRGNTEDCAFRRWQRIEQQIKKLEMELTLVAYGVDRHADRQQRLQSPFARMQCHRRHVTRTEIHDVAERQACRRRERGLIVESDGAF